MFEGGGGSWGSHPSIPVPGWPTDVSNPTGNNPHLPQPAGGVRDAARGPRARDEGVAELRPVVERGAAAPLPEPAQAGPDGAGREPPAVARPAPPAGGRRATGHWHRRDRRTHPPGGASAGDRGSVREPGRCGRCGRRGRSAVSPSVRRRGRLLWASRGGGRSVPFSTMSRRGRGGRGRPAGQRRCTTWRGQPGVIEGDRRSVGGTGPPADAHPVNNGNPSDCRGSRGIEGNRERRGRDSNPWYSFTRTPL